MPHGTPRVIALVDVHKHDARDRARRVAIAHSAARLKTKIFVRPDVRPIFWAIDLEAAALIERHVNLHVAIMHRDMAGAELHTRSCEVLALSELLRRAIPDAPIALRQRADARVRRTER